MAKKLSVLDLHIERIRKAKRLAKRGIRELELIEKELTKMRREELEDQFQPDGATGDEMCICGHARKAHELLGGVCSLCERGPAPHRTCRPGTCDGFTYPYR